MRHLAVIGRLAIFTVIVVATVVFNVFTAAAPMRVAPGALPFEMTWSREYEGAPPVAAAVAGDSRLVAGFADRVEFLSLSTGDSAGVLPLPSPQLSCDASTCVSADATTIRSIDAARRTVRWQKQLPGPLAFAPTLRSGWVFLAITDTITDSDGKLHQSGRVVALRDTDGATVWTLATKAPLTGPLSVDGNRIAIATADASISLLDVQTGSRLWTTALFNGVPGTPKLGGGLVIVGTEKSDLVFINAATGSLQSPQRTSAVIVGAPALDEHLIYTAGQDGVLRAFDRRGHGLKWYANLPTRPAAGGPVVTDGLTIVALRTGAFQVYLGDGDGQRAAAALPAPGSGDSTALLQVPPIVAGTGTSTRLVTISAGVGDATKWRATVTGRAGPLPLIALPTAIPGLPLTLTPPR